jgi:polyhydroxyalkanoate synthesis regulator phasin
MSKKKKQRTFDPVSLSFLDVISCGFGAVVLIFLILDHSANRETANSDPALAAEVNLLDQEIREGQDGLVAVRNTISDVDLQIVQAQGLASRIQEDIESFLEELAAMENESLSEEEKVESLRAEIAALEEELKRLREAEENMTGNNIREFIGDGNRQYLTGLILGGNRILILVDISGSMLDNTIVNIIRRRNMPEAERLNGPKWQQLLKTVDWLTTQLPVPSQYQIYVFNNEIRPLLPGTDGQWLEVADAEQLSSAVDTLKRTVPAEGTNLENVFTAVAGMPTPPDNIFLLTDGLPTLGSRGRNSGTISGRDREQLFERAMRELPKGIPVNVIMLPLEGDPAAPGWYWQLAMQSGGSFMMPSPDWP